MCPLDYVKELTSSQFLLPKHLTPASALWSQCRGLHSALVFSCTTNKFHSTSCALNNLRSCLEKALCHFWTYWQYYTPLVALQLYNLSIFNVTWALNTNIIIMTTVVTGDTNPIVRTLQYISLISSAGKIIKPDWPTSSSIEGIHTCNRTCRTITVWYSHLSLVQTRTIVVHSPSEG